MRAGAVFLLLLAAAALVCADSSACQGTGCLEAEMTAAAGGAKQRPPLKSTTKADYTVSGYFRFESSELNLFEPPGAQDGAVVSYGIPSQASNVVSNLNVPIDASLEFGSDFKGSVLGVGGRGEMSVDLTESGTITIHRTSSNAAGPSTPATITLVSDLFKQYGTVNSSPVQFGEYPEFPAGSVTASLNSNDGTLTISMDNTQWLADAGGLWQLLLANGECSDNGVLKPSGTVCRRASTCTRESRCDGISAACPSSPQPNGYRCHWKPDSILPANVYLAQEDKNNDSKNSAADKATTAYDDGGHKWHECEGFCYNSECRLDLAGPKCCYAPHPDYYYYGSDNSDDGGAGYDSYHSGGGLYCRKTDY